MKLLRYLLCAVALLSLHSCSDDKLHITINIFGDSTMADKIPEVYPETGWCQVLDDYFDESVTISNHAVNGRSSRSFIDENRWQLVLDSLKPGDFVFIQFGHNDEKEYDPERYTTPFGTYTENLHRFISETVERGAMPVLFTPIVRRKFFESGLLEHTHGDYPEAVRIYSFCISLICYNTINVRLSYSHLRFDRCTFDGSSKGPYKAF
jgi:lysophospholipase L1-like esterase